MQTPGEELFLAIWSVCLTARLPQSADGSRRQGKNQKLKLHSAQGRRGMVPSDEYWPRRCQPSQWEHVKAGGSQSRTGETQEPSGRDRSCHLQPNQSEQPPGQGSLHSSARIKQMDENSLALESCA